MSAAAALAAAARPIPFDGIPDHVRGLLDRLHAASSAQESALAQDGFKGAAFDDVMRDKFIALHEAKARFVYGVCRAINAKTVVEAGTSYGVSTIYLALAVTHNVAASGGRGRVIATENEPAKAAKAREHWRACGEAVGRVIELREGDLRETLADGLEEVDFLLLDIWAPLALPTLKLVQPRLRRGAAIVIDNTVQAAQGYEDLIGYMRAPGSPFDSTTLSDFSGGLDVSVYRPPE